MVELGAASSRFIEREGKMTFYFVWVDLACLSSVANFSFFADTNRLFVGGSPAATDRLHRGRKGRSKDSREGIDAY